MNSGCSVWLGWTVRRGWSWPRLPLSLIRSNNYSLTKSNAALPRPYQTISKHEEMWIAWSRAPHTRWATSTSRVAEQGSDTAHHSKHRLFRKTASSLFRDDTIFSDDATCHQDISTLVTDHKYVTNIASHNTHQLVVVVGGVLAGGGGGGWCPEPHGGDPGHVSPVWLVVIPALCTTHLQLPCPTEHRPLLADGPLGSQWASQGTFLLGRQERCTMGHHYLYHTRILGY